MIDAILGLHKAVRYVAVYGGSELRMASREGTAGASSSETDTYEELLVNPTVLLLTGQRGNIDCGGMEYVLIRYGNFFQLVIPTAGGHVSVCIEKDADPVQLAGLVLDHLQVE